jgi:hypothetical protein
MEMAAGEDATRAIAIDLFGRLAAETDGDLGRVRRIVKLTRLANSLANFTEQHLVANGASELYAAANR